MKRLLKLLPCMLLLAGANSFAWSVEGKVVCDVQPNGVVDEFDTPFADITVRTTRVPLYYIGDVTTDPNGYYYKWLPVEDATYVQSLPLPGQLPPDATWAAIPGAQFSVDGSDYHKTVDFLVQSETCRTPPEGCWLTGGGVKFEPVTKENYAEHGPKDTMGGVIYPACSGKPSKGGQWNHVAHSEKLHLQAFDVLEVKCGNLDPDDHPPGSESPVTPYNYLEWYGVGRAKGIKGSKADYTTVYFKGRAEDRNEPGSEGPAEGTDIDRYFFKAYTMNGASENVIYCADGTGDTSGACDDPTNGRLISGGNMQLHYSSCE